MASNVPVKPVQLQRHQTAGDDPCVFVIIVHGPFDARIIDANPPC